MPCDEAAAVGVVERAGGEDDGGVRTLHLAHNNDVPEGFGFYYQEAFGGVCDDFFHSAADLVPDVFIEDGGSGGGGRVGGAGNHLNE